MPKGVTGTCAFCSLDATVRDIALAAWRSGRSYQALRPLLASHGYDLTVAQLQYCPCRSGHHDRGDIGDVNSRSTNRLGKIAELLERSGINPDDIARVEQVRLSSWEGLTKNEDGEPIVTPLSGASVVLSPAWENGPQWPVVDRAAQARVVPPKPVKRKRTKVRTVAVLPDVQIGYRRDIDDGTLDPFHDEQAIGAALRVVAAVDPTDVVHLGDLIDAPFWGKYEQEATFQLTVQPGIDRAHRYLAETVAAAPNARHTLLEGNHDRRLQRAILTNAMTAFGLRRAEAPQDWPVLSVPHLLRTDDLGVEWLAGYPANLLWLADDVAVIHGSKVRSSGSTAAAVLDDSAVCVVYGHVHRIELAYKTRQTRAGAARSWAASPGCLCRVDGAVPSVRGSTDAYGRPIPTVESWQQGIGIITIEPGHRPAIELVEIIDGVASFRGQRL